MYSANAGTGTDVARWRTLYGGAINTINGTNCGIKKPDYKCVPQPLTCPFPYPPQDTDDTTSTSVAGGD